MQEGGFNIQNAHTSFMVLQDFIEAKRLLESMQSNRQPFPKITHVTWCPGYSYGPPTITRMIGHNLHYDR